METSHFAFVSLSRRFFFVLLFSSCFCRSIYAPRGNKRREVQDQCGLDFGVGSVAGCIFWFRLR